MPDIIFDIITHTVEYQQWSKTAMRVSVIGAVILTFVIAHALWRQKKKIYELRSGEGVSVVWMSYFTGMLASFVIYGIYKGSAALVFNCGVSFIMQLPILWGLWRFKRWTTSERYQAAVYTIGMPVAMVMTPYEETTFTIFALGMIYSTSTQPYEMWQIIKKQTKNEEMVLDPWLVASNAAGSLFWTVFAFSTKAVALTILNPPLFVLFSLTFYLWFRYFRDPAETRV